MLPSAEQTHAFLHLAFVGLFTNASKKYLKIDFATIITNNLELGHLTTEEIMQNSF